MKANYEEDKIIVSSTEPTGIDRKKVWIKKGKNLFDKNNYNLYKGFIQGNTLRFVDSNLAYTVYLKVKPNTTYTISREVINSTLSIGIGEEIPVNGNIVNGYNSYAHQTSATVTTGKRDNYLYIYLLWNENVTVTITDILESLQVEQGSTATEYEPYIEKEIYVKNDNGVFEKYVLEDINEINNKFSNFYNEDNGRVRSRAIEISNPGNIDNMLNSGIFVVMNTGGGTFPSGLGGNSCMVLVQTDNIQYNAQLAFGFGSDKIAIRRRNGSTTWTAWKYIALS